MQSDERTDLFNAGSAAECLSTVSCLLQINLALCKTAYDCWGP